ncbi:hypothetical protein Bbelb_403340 [Branchiostoma belcheri]|nr:hypothetical protein Bbelb_403340 [Branchiostoma belcheri]
MGDFELEENDFTDSCGEDWEELHDQRESVTEAFSWFRSREDGRSRSDDTCSLRMETMPLYHGAQLTYAERKNFYEAILRQRRKKRRTTTSIQDITDGVVYKSIEELQDPRNISLLMNTDGIKVFNSSNYGLWPVYLAINELLSG